MYDDGKKERTSIQYGCCGREGANKKMHMTKPARRSVSIIARYEGFGVASSFVLPVRARDWHVILGVIANGLEESEILNKSRH